MKREEEESRWSVHLVNSRKKHQRQCERRTLLQSEPSTFRFHCFDCFDCFACLVGSGRKKSATFFLQIVKQEREKHLTHSPKVWTTFGKLLFLHSSSPLLPHHRRPPHLGPLLGRGEESGWESGRGGRRRGGSCRGGGVVVKRGGRRVECK